MNALCFKCNKEFDEKNIRFFIYDRKTGHYKDLCVRCTAKLVVWLDKKE